MKRPIGFLCLLAGIAYFSAVSPAFAEHPGTALPERSSKEELLSADTVISAIQNHIDTITSENNGIFPLHDDQENKDLSLKFVRVHTDKVSYIKKEGAYFACTDFITADGKDNYDIDFWMKKDANGDLSVYAQKIHKKNGIPRFTYKDDQIVPVQ